MAIYRNVHISFWQDEDMLELTPEQKYFYLYLMTNSKTNQVGCYKISTKVMTFETGYNMDTVSKLLKFFSDNGKIMYDKGNSEILIKNWMKYNWSKSPKVISCIDNEMKNVASEKHALYIKDYVYKQYGYSIDTVCIPNRNKNKPRTNQEQEKEPQSGKPDLPSFAINLSKKILEQSGNKYKEPQVIAGARVIHDINRIDEYDPAEIEKVIEFALADDFWRGNVLSGASLRKRKPAGDPTKYEKIRSKWLKTKPAGDDVWINQYKKEDEEFNRKKKERRND